MGFRNRRRRLDTGTEKYLRHIGIPVAEQSHVHVLPDTLVSEPEFDAVEYGKIVRMAIHQVLAETHSSTWGRSFAIDSFEGRCRAVEFIEELLLRIAVQIDDES